MNGSPVAWGKPGDGKWCNTAKVLLISMVCKRSVPMKILHSHKGCFFPTENTDPCQGFFPFSLSLIFFSASWGFRECTLSVFPRESGSTPPQFFILLLKAVSFPLPTHMHIQVQNKSVSIMSCAMSFPIRLYSSLHCTWRHIHIWLISTDLRVQTETSTFFNLGLVLRFFFLSKFSPGTKMISACSWLSKWGTVWVPTPAPLGRLNMVLLHQWLEEENGKTLTFQTVMFYSSFTVNRRFISVGIDSMSSDPYNDMHGQVSG